MDIKKSYRVIFTPVNHDFIDCDLEDKMSTVKKIVSLVHALRKNNGIKVRQPLQKIILYSKEKIDYLLQFKEIILHETNVKELKIIDDSSLILNFSIKPNFKILGQKYKEKTKDVAEDIKKLNCEELKLLDEGRSVVLNCGVSIIKEDCIFDINPRENVCIEKYKDLVIALDTKLTPQLEEEGIARDFVNCIQNYRKIHEFNVSDSIEIDFFSTNKKINEAISNFIDKIKGELLCHEIRFHNERLSVFENIKLNGEDVFVKVTKI